MFKLRFCQYVNKRTRWWLRTNDCSLFNIRRIWPERASADSTRVPVCRYEIWTHNGATRSSAQASL